MAKNIFISKNWLQIILAIVIVISIIGILALRIYAIYNTVSIHTWDDIGYRNYAIESANYIGNISKALQDVFLPNADLLDNSRAIGYHSWLVLFLKLRISGNPEQVFQLANLGLLIFQAIILFIFAKWSTKSQLFAGTLTFLYLSSPIVFGLNRWVMTENYVMLGLLVFSCIPIWLFSQDFRPLYRREILAGIGGAWLIGMFGTIREYALPSFFLTAIATSMGLIWQKRLDAFLSFTIIFAICCLTFLEGWVQLFKLSRYRVTQSEYYHPLQEWIPHFFVHVIGIALAVFLLVNIVIIGINIYQNYQSKQWDFKQFKLDLSSIRFNQGNNPLQLLWLTNFSLVLLYSFIILISQSRQARAGILLIFSLLSLILISIRYFNISEKIFKASWFNFISLILIFLSWGITYHQLFIAFDGGKSYTHTAYDLEYYNHPLYLRPLRSPEDMHTEL
ncbi:MAG: hypothetical protein VKJ02_17630 [Snowella sp.]|nr:hypothetical protein [Snowella sp.]